ncbi:MAG: Fpg/Nei family DNA glycosylase [Micropruina sp.]|nr:MAG: Fpg/Nei family DNA glycosylase [Micropruina sp.]
MPEGDTVWRTARRLHEAFTGEPLTVCDLRWPGLSTLDFRGVVTTEVVSRGKHILHRLGSGWTIHSHLRMDGSWRILRTSQARPPGNTVRAVLATAAWTAHGVRLGMLDVLATSDESSVVGHLGPDLLGPDWDPTEAVRRLRGSGTSIGAALLDQRNLAGLGTLWCAETLFLQRLHPWHPVAELTDDQLAGVVARAHRLLSVSKDHAIPSSTGLRRDGANTYAHGRSGLPCRRCGTTVRVAMIGPPTRERTMFYCPACQGGLGPTDDGRPQRPLGAR